MPFTFSHPALILPLRLLPSRWFSLTGLVIGSLTPDFEYFVRMRVQSDYSHTITGLFWFDLPLGLSLGFVFHNVVRDSLFDNLPAILGARLAKFKQFNWNKYFITNWLVVIISIVIGAASHLLWDSFTHGAGYFVRTIYSLQESVNFFGRQVPVYKILQHSSTLMGGIAIGIALFALPAERNVTGRFNLKYWIVLTGLALTILAIRLAWGLHYSMYGHVIVSGLSAVFISLILTTFIMKRIRRKILRGAEQKREYLM